MHIWLLIGFLLSAEGEPTKPDPRELAQLIDRRLATHQQAVGVVPTARTDDSEFLRRASLDLIGRTPTPQEIQNFINDLNANKRQDLIEQLLSSPQHSRHFAHVWRALLLPEAETEPQLRYFEPGFEAWLEGHRTRNSGFDVLVRELLTVPIARPDETPEFVLRDLKKPNPIAFIAAKSADPAKIASSSVRLFLGLRLECAQCHNHPFDHWSRQQFWNQAAFFSGIERRGRGPFAPLIEFADRNTIPLMDTKDVVPALFLDEQRPSFETGQPPRIKFAEWMTSPSNPYFARSVVNRIWSQFMGTGLVDPVDDFRDSDSSSQAALLNELAEAFKASKYDLTIVMKAICFSDAYQRSSRLSQDNPSDSQDFAHMAIKPMSAEQFFDSLAQAIGYESKSTQDGNEDPLRRRVGEIFVNNGISADPETSVAQALALMNGTVIHRATQLESSPRLQSVMKEFPDSLSKQIESLYIATLSRFPTQNEQQQLIAFLENGEEAKRGQRLGDIFWMLLNSAEFRWNH